MSQFRALEITPDIQDFINRSLEEDIGLGDFSSLAAIPGHEKGTARLLFKEDGIVAGITLAEAIFHTVDPLLQVDTLVSDGATIQKGDTGLTVSGPARSILSAERLMLNCMQRLSGIATQTNKIVTLIADTGTRLLDTRKTTPLMRKLEKWAVTVGGGHNHRFGLFDMIMLKDNHIDYAGGISNAILHTQQYLKDNNLTLAIEVETRNLNEVEQVMQAGGVQRIMLDNFTPALLHEAVKLIGKQYETEASGGITLENIRAYAETGVDFISVGALTHSVKSLDISLKVAR